MSLDIDKEIDLLKRKRWMLEKEMNDALRRIQKEEEVVENNWHEVRQIFYQVSENTRSALYDFAVDSSIANPFFQEMSDMEKRTHNLFSRELERLETEFYNEKKQYQKLLDDNEEKIYSMLRRNSSDY